MAIIHVPRPKQSSMNPNRPASSLLLTQVEHMHAAERKLPHRYHSEIYVNAIKTEGEASEYIAKVTAAVHMAHDDAARRGSRAHSRPGRGLSIAAAADDKNASSARNKVSATKDKAATTRSDAVRGKTKSRRKK
jgi:hypothetical protein